MEKWRLLDVEVPDSAYMNMAIDEAVFIEKTRNQMQPTTLRLWRNKSAVVIGRFQSIKNEINQEICRQKGVQITRRFTGGGTVYQDFGNINFSICIGAEYPLLKGLNITDSFRILTSGVGEGLRTMRIETVFSPPSDLLLKDKKISGNSQSRKRNVIFHHGTLLVNTDLEMLMSVLNSSVREISKRMIESRKMPVTNLQDETEHKIDVEEVKNSIKKGFEKIFNIDIVQGQLNPQEKEKAQMLFAEKYSKDEWNLSP